MRYETPTIESRVPLQAFMTIGVGSPTPPAVASPVWRSPDAGDAGDGEV